MMSDFQNLNPILQAFLATCFTWALTALGASSVFLTKQVNRKVLDSMFGFTEGVMIAVSYWSLLAPSIEMSKGKDIPVWFPAATGFILRRSFFKDYR